MSDSPSSDPNPGVWVERQCEALGVSVSQVARDAKVDRSTLYRWKRGHSEPNWGPFQRVRSVIENYWSRREDADGAA